MPNGKADVISEIKRILSGIRKQRQPLQTRYEPQVITATQAREYGIDIDMPEDWMLKVMPPVDGEEPKMTFISPQRIEVPLEDIWVTPEGGWLTRQEQEALEVQREQEYTMAQESQRAQQVELSLLFKQLFPELIAPPTIRPSMLGTFIKTEYAEEDLIRLTQNYINIISQNAEAQNLFLETVYREGRKPETERLLKILMPQITEQDLTEFFATAEAEITPEKMPEAIVMAGEQLGYYWQQLRESQGKISYERWQELGSDPNIPHYDKGETGLKWGVLGKTLLAAIGVAGGWIEKYAGRPWELAILEASRITPGYEPSKSEQAARKIMDEAYYKYGWGAVFSPEVSLAWETWTSGVEPRTKAYLEFTEWINPLYIVPIGGTLGFAARYTSKIPVIGRMTRYLAAGVNLAERGLTYPVAKPTEVALKYTTKGLEKLGMKIGDAAVNRLIKQTKNLESLMDLPASDDILKGVLVDNWMKKALTIASKVPILKAGIEKSLGWRVLVKRESQAVEDIVGRAAVVHAEISRRGINAKAPKVWELRAIESNPIKFFGFNKNAYSEKMAGRLLPEYVAEKEIAGTLEHIFTKPEMYNWTGLERGLEYVTKLHEINTEITNMLIKEAVPPKVLTEDWWIHRVVEGKFNPEGELIALRGRPGVKAGRIGAKPSYEMHRKAPTMAEGIAWGVQYNRNPEVAVSSYIEEAFKKIADTRFGKYVEGFGITPAERLAERFPEVIERLALTKDELADAAKFQSIINRSIRGEKLPKQTLDAMERRFPELGRRFRSLAEEPARAERQLRELLSENEKLIRNLQRRVEKVEAIDIEAIKSEARAEAVRIGIPDDQKLTEAFRLMEYEDRIAFRETMNGQLSDIGQMNYEQMFELQAIRETIEVSKLKKMLPIWKRIQGRKDQVTDLTLREFQNVTGKQMPVHLKTDRFGRKWVTWDDAMDYVVTEYGYKTPEQMYKALDELGQLSIKQQDLTLLVNMAETRSKGIERMLKVLDDVDASPQFVAKVEPEITVPKAEPGMPEAGVQKDIFGYETPVFPKGKGQVTQVSMDDYGKLVEAWKKAGLPDDQLPVGIKPKIEGVKGLEAEAQVAKVKYEPPKIKTADQRKIELEALRKEVKTLTEARKAPYWQAKAEKAFRMEQVRQPEIGEGYLPQPFATGRIFERDFIDSFNKFFGHDAGLGVLRVTSDIAGILRITKAALDFSAMAIQGLPSWGLAHSYLMFNPKIGVKMLGSWYKAFFESTRAFFDPGAFAGYMTKNNKMAMQRIAFGGSSHAVDYFAALQVRTGIGGKAEWLMEHIPLKPYHRAETAFYSAGEIVRDEFWRILSPKAIATGKEFELARFLDRITGIMDSAAIGVPLTTRQIEQTFMWFAPNYTRACLTVLADIFRGGMTGAEARKALGGMIAAGSAMYTGVQFALAMTEGKSDEEAWDTVKEGFGIREDPITRELEWRPSAQFMTVKVDNYNFGFGGFWYGLLRLAGNINECINQIGDKEVVDLVRIMKNGSFNNKDNPFIYWWYSRSSPIVGTGFELANGKDFLGYPIETPQEYAKYIMTRFEPIWAEQGINWLVPGLARDNEVPEGLARAAIVPAELFGLRTFPESSWVKFYDKINDYIKRIPEEEIDEKQIEAWRRGELEWQHLTEMQKANLLSRYPELEEFYGKAQSDSALRASPNWEAWQGRMDEERKIYYDRIEELTKQLLRGEIDTREYREKAGDAGSNYGSILGSIEREPNYADIYDYFNRKEAEGDKYGLLDDIMLGEYQSKILYAEDLIDRKGDYDWDERDRRIDAFIEKWGQDGYDRVQQYLQQEKYRKGLNEVWIRKSADTDKLSRAYWQLPYKPIMEMDEDDELEGNIPAEYYAIWKQYQTLKTDQEKEDFIKRYPDMAKDWRAEYRKSHPEDDARLALWGYGGRIQSQEAYDLVVQWGRELGIPLEQMGLGLPPRNLIENYFEYNEIVAETSANNPKAKLYRLENPDWEEWAEDNWGWKPVDDHPEVLRINVNYSEQDKQYDSIVMDDKVAQSEAREQYLEQNPEYAIARRRREAYQDKFPDDLIDSYVEYYKLPDRGFWRERFLIENEEFYRAMLKIRGIEELEPEKIPVQAYDEIYDKWRDLFEQYDSATGTATQRAQFRNNLFESNPEFHKDWLRRSAYGKLFAEDQIENYVDYYMIMFEGKPEGVDYWYEDDWFLMEHMDFYDKALKILGWEPRDFSKVPTRDVYQLYLTYRALPSGNPRFDYRAKHPELDAWLVKAFGLKPIGERGEAEAPKTPWEEAAEVEKFKGLFK